MNQHKEDLQKTLWNHQDKMIAYQMYTQGYDDPVTAYQILTGQEGPTALQEAEQKDFADFAEE
ncbi:MAG: hypothetical protein ACOWWO_13695 [Peptococcaceae bacterium]